MKTTFKQETSFNKRVELSNRLRAAHKDRLPVIIQVSPTNAKKLILKRNKFLVPSDVSIGALLTEIRKQSDLRSQEALFLFCGSSGGVLVPTANMISEVYNKHKDEDGFLYITAALENTFGAVQLLDGVLDNVLDNSARFVKRLGLHIF